MRAAARLPFLAGAAVLGAMAAPRTASAADAPVIVVKDAIQPHVAIDGEGTIRATFPALASGGGIIGLAHEVNRDGDEWIAFRVLAGPWAPGSGED
jgi:hypothetical protein